MKMKKMQVIAIVVLITISSVVTSAHAGALDVPMRYQEKRNWCWNACSQMLLRYYDRHFVEQCEIAEFVRGHKAVFGNTNCCLNPGISCNLGNFITGTGGIEHILSNYNVLNTVSNTVSSYNDCRNEINAGHPMIIRWAWDGGGAHYVVVAGYYDASGWFFFWIPDRLLIQDPWFGEGPSIMTYNSVVDHPNGSWSYTLESETPVLSDDEVTFYDHSNYGGSSGTWNSSTSYVGSTYNDRFSSAKVRGIPFIAYQHSYYGGYSWPITPRDYHSYTEWDGLNDEISSIREMPGAYKDTAIILFEHSYYRGSYRIITGDNADLQNIGFNNKVSSLIVVNKIWRVYEGSNYSGTHYAVTSFGGPNRDGFYPYPSSWGGSGDRISSVYWVPESISPIILYRHSNLKGRAVCISPYDSGSILDNLTELDFNDRTSSIKTFADTWTVYQHSNQGGSSQVLNANTWYTSAASWGGSNDSISSLSFSHTDDWF